MSMDFKDGLPKSYDKQVIFMVVDRLSDYAHFMPVSRPYIVVDVIQTFMANIYKLHDLSKSILSDQYPSFTSNFW